MSSRRPAANRHGWLLCREGAAVAERTHAVRFRSVGFCRAGWSVVCVPMSFIAGLPTWFTIRANKHGWIARKKEVDVLIGEEELAKRRGDIAQMRMQAGPAGYDCEIVGRDEAQKMLQKFGGK